MDNAHPLTDRDRADTLLRMGRHTEAIPLYRKLVEAFPEEESHLLALAWALHDSGNPKEAAACFERLFRKELTRKLVIGFAYDELVRIYREGKNWEALIRSASGPRPLSRGMSVCSKPSAMHTSRRIVPPTPWRYSKR
ncbi:MAG: tetratricopeptide repeat protein [Proteobacteria bacterium]|nr:tetratricopeptide repeat protein [Pseudomonadota bacterium]